MVYPWTILKQQSDFKFNLQFEQNLINNNRMQTSIMLNAKNQQNCVLTISHRVDDQLSIVNDSRLERNQLLDSNLVSSRMTETYYKITAMDKVVELELSPQHPQFIQCQTCAIWKKWAQKQETAMIELELKLIQKEIQLKEFISNLQLIIHQKNLILQQYRHQLSSEKAAKQYLQLNLEKIHDKNEKKNERPAVSTPLKTVDIARSPHSQSNDVLNIKMSQFVQDNKKQAIKTSTIATKKNEWTEYENNLQKTAKVYQKTTSKNENIDKYLFENQMLKEYNSALLQRLKIAKYKKSFLH